ncbi:ORF6C domain-containing protein [Clostridioides difficile]|uniref:ORF6C domain-containing protein n=1 Tax=Clostridioides difficile TaxID=1496 RepID=UPI000980124A|nr:ORF6C domain-containing protein [Clostridioides difficile]SJP29845.1 ORF6C domain [Clostridioides difficile]
MKRRRCSWCGKLFYLKEKSKEIYCCKECKRKAKKVATKSLGGHGSKAYKNKSLRGKVYSDIYHQIKREFGVDSYKAIKRCQLDKVLEIVNNYKLPIVFEDEIRLLNSQLSIVS